MRRFWRLSLSGVAVRLHSFKRRGSGPLGTAIGASCDAAKHGAAAISWLSQ